MSEGRKAENLDTNQAPIVLLKSSFPNLLATAVPAITS